MLKAVREIGSVLCRIGLWDCFGDAGVWLLLLAVIRVHRELSQTSSFIGCYQGAQGTESDESSTQSHGATQNNTCPAQT